MEETMRLHICSNLGLNPCMDEVLYGTISHFVVFYVCVNSQFRAQKYIQLFHLFILYTVEHDNKHKTNCSRVNTLGLIHTETTNFETILSFHH